jgi:hypothetical protein
MSREKLDQLFDNTVRDTLIENLERRQREIIEETERYLASELGDPFDFENEADAIPAEDAGDWYGEDDEEYNDVRLNWDYEDDEVWDG